MSSALRTRRHAGSTPAGKANHQRVGEPGRPHLPWKQGIGGSNPSTLTIFARWPIGEATDSEYVQTGSIPVRAADLAPWRNRNAAVCKTAMSRGSTGRGIQHALWTNRMVSHLLNGPMLVRVQPSAPGRLAQLERALRSYRGGCRFEPGGDRHFGESIGRVPGAVC